MRVQHAFVHLSVKILALLSASLLSACSYINEHYTEQCNSHAYTRAVLSDFLTSRFHSNAPVRMAVIPFSVPANLSGYDTERPGLGNKLAWEVQAQFLHSGQVPIVEVLNRQDWPAKKEEFFTGNFGALAAAREAGYDLVFLGYLDPLRSLDSMNISTKLIEVESGITVWYGDTGVVTYAPELRKTKAALPWQRLDPSVVDSNALVERLARCVVKAVTSENEKL